jgi:hypothetical protein
MSTAIPDPFANIGIEMPIDDFIQHVTNELGFGSFTLDVDQYVNAMVEDFMGNDEGEVTFPLPNGSNDNTMDWDYTDDVENSFVNQDRSRKPNEFQYKFGDVLFKSAWYVKFLAPDVREKTYRLSAHDRYGSFRSDFRMPLSLLDKLTQMFLDRGWVTYTKRITRYDELYLRCQLRIMAALKVLDAHTPFRQLETTTNICTEEHRLFFHHFLDKMVSVKEEFLHYPKDMEELKPVLDKYESLFLPGCGGSIDVIHIKWSACPAGDRNRCTGKEKYPTLSFEVVSDNARRILAVSSVQYGTRGMINTLSRWMRQCLILKGVVQECPVGIL